MAFFDFLKQKEFAEITCLKRIWKFRQIKNKNSTKRLRNLKRMRISFQIQRDSKFR